MVIVLKKNRSATFIIMMLLPTLLIVSFINVYPTIKGIFISFTNLKVYNFGREKLVGFKNYLDIFSDPQFPEIVLNTIKWVGFSVVFQLIFGMGLALLMRKPFKGRGIYAGLVFYPWALSGFAIGLIWSWLLNGEYGIVNDILMRMGIIRHGIQFLSDPTLAMISVTTSR